MKTSEFLSQLESFLKTRMKVAVIHLVFGAISLSLSSSLWSSKGKDILDGLAHPLFFIGIFQILIGVFIFFQSNGKLNPLSKLVTEDRNHFFSEQIAYVKTTLQITSVYRFLEIGAILSGVVLLAVYNSSDLFWLGAGIGLAIEGGILLTIHYFSEMKTENYYAQLLDFKEFTFRAEQKRNSFTSV